MRVSEPHPTVWGGTMGVGGAPAEEEEDGVDGRDALRHHHGGHLVTRMAFRTTYIVFTTGLLHTDGVFPTG